MLSKPDVAVRMQQGLDRCVSFVCGICYAACGLALFPETNYQVAVLESWRGGELRQGAGNTSHTFSIQKKWR